MVTKDYRESRPYQGQKDRFFNKVEKSAVSRAKQIHKQDTEARYKPLRDEHGNQVYDSHGRPVEAIHGPLTKQGVAVGRHLDPQGRGRELRGMAAETRLNNALLNEAAIGRAQSGEATDFVVGGRHQWSQNLAYDPDNNPSVGKTHVRGPAATGGPPPAGLAGSPGGGAYRGKTGPMEFHERRMDWRGSQDAGIATNPLTRTLTAAGAWGEGRGARRDAREWARDDARGLVRPIIGYRVQGGDQNFSNQQFSATGHGPSSRPGSPTGPTVNPIGFQPPAGGGTPAPRPVPPSGHPPTPPAAPPAAPSPSGPFQPPAPARPAVPPSGHPPAAPAAPAAPRPPVPPPAANPFGQPPATPAPIAPPASPVSDPFRPSRLERAAHTVENVADIAASAAGAARTGFAAGEVVFPEGGGIPGAVIGAGVGAAEARKRQRSAPTPTSTGQPAALRPKTTG